MSPGLTTNVDTEEILVHFAPRVVSGDIAGLTAADANERVSVGYTVQGYVLAGGAPTLVNEIAVLPGAVADPKPLDIFPHYPDLQETAVRILPYRYIAQSAVVDPWIYRSGENGYPRWP